MIEHFRRVWYAKTHFGETRRPWDDRGEVYIRYGEPDHRTGSTNPNFTTSAEIDVVRDRYMHAIYGSDPPSMLERGRMPVYPLVDPDEMRGDDMLSQLGLGANSFDPERDRQITSYGSEADAPEPTPSFGADGVASLTRWEEWTYTTIGNGLQITFVDRIGRGDHSYATPPPTTNLRMASTLRQFASEEQVNMARQHTPDRYAYDSTQDPLDFYYYTAQFRTKEGGTQLDVYYGLPVGELSFQKREDGRYGAQVVSGLAVLDTLWNIKGRFSYKRVR